MTPYDWSVVDDEPWRLPDPVLDQFRTDERVWIARWLLAFWAVLAALVFVVVVRRVGHG